MKYVLLCALAVFALGFALAVGSIKPLGGPGITVLRWATDPNPARRVQAAEFTRLHPDIRVQVDAGDRSRLVIQCATGAGPDVMDLYEDAMQTMAESGVLQDVTQIAHPAGFGPEATYPAIRPALSVGGKQYRFPCNVTAQAILYNRKVFDDHHVPYPKPDWTWDEFIATGKAILDSPSDSGRKHLALANAGPLLLDDLLASHGAHYFSEDRQRCTLDSPEALAAMEQYHDLMFKHGVVPRPEQSASMSGQGGWGSGGVNWFSAGDAAMICIGRWYIVQLVNYPELRSHVAAVREPHLPGQPSRVMAAARGAAINARSRHREAAVKFLGYLASPEYGSLIVKDGDSLPPLPTLARDGQALANAAVPDPAFHQVFVEAIADATVRDRSPYIDPTTVSRWLTERINQVENQVVGPHEAMRSLTAEINRTIRLNLERRPDLRGSAQP